MKTSQLIDEIADAVNFAIEEFCFNEPKAKMCVKGAQGPPGVKGAQGLKGVPGKTGERGQKGAKCEKCSPENTRKAHVTKDEIGDPITNPGIFVSPSTLTTSENKTARFVDWIGFLDCLG